MEDSLVSNDYSFESVQAILDLSYKTQVVRLSIIIGDSRSVKNLTTENTSKTNIKSVIFPNAKDQ